MCRVSCVLPRVEESACLMWGCVWRFVDWVANTFVELAHVFAAFPTGVVPIVAAPELGWRAAEMA